MALVNLAQIKELDRFGTVAPQIPTSTSTKIFETTTTQKLIRKMKNPKMVMIEHVDAQIRRVDIYTEELLFKLDNEKLEAEKNSIENEDSPRSKYYSNNNRYRRGSSKSVKHAIGEQSNSGSKVLTSELIERCRTRIIDQLNKYLNDMLEEYEFLNRNDLSSVVISTKPTSVLERQFGFVLKVTSLEAHAKFGLVFVTIDFILTADEIEQLEALINLSKHSRNPNKIDETDVLDDVSYDSLKSSSYYRIILN